MKLRKGTWVGIAAALGLAGGPAYAQAQPPASTASLAERIHQAERATYGVDNKAELARIEALKAEAARDPALPVRDRAALEWLAGIALDASDQIEPAAAAFDRGLAVLSAASTSESDLMARLQLGRGAMEQRLGHDEAAQRMVGAARDMVVRLHGANAPELLPFEGELGLLDYLEGRLVEAIGHYRMALGHGAPLEADRAFHAIANLDLAVFESRHGDEAEQMFHAQQALAEARQWLPEGHSAWGEIYSNLASFHTAWGRFDEAESFAEQAVAYTRTRFGPGAFEYGNAQRTLAIVWLRQGRLDAAKRLMEEALVNLADPKTDVANRFVEGDTYRALARVALARHDPAAAEAAVNAGFASLERNKVRNGFGAMLHYELALAQAMAGKYDLALASVDVALVQLLKIRAPWEVDLTNAKVLRARILARLGRTAQSWDEAEAISRTMQARLEDPRVGAGARRVLANDYRNNFARLAEIAANAGHDEAAFALAQLASFSELAASSLALAARAAGADREAAIHVRSLQDLQVRLDHLERERNFAAGRGGAELVALEAQLKDARQRLDNEVLAVARLAPAYAQLSIPHPQPLAEAIAALAPGQALMLPVQSDDRLLVLVVTRHGLARGMAPLDSAAQLQAVRALRHSLESEGTASFDPAPAWRLGSALFNRPVLAALRGIHEVVVVGAGPLMTVPFAMLLTAPPVAGPAAAQPCAGLRDACSVRPLLGVAPGARASISSDFLGVGDPMLGPAGNQLRGKQTGQVAPMLMRGGAGDAAALRALPSLPASARELAAIATSFAAQGTRLLTGAGATEAALRAEPLEHYGVIAFATHGLVSGELRGLTEPALVLTPPGDAAAVAENDGLLTASEAAGLTLHARWVILSACNTGAGAENGAAGISGLARGFMQAGAESMLVSLWPLRDDAAAQLTVDTVRFHARGLSQAESLRRAELRLLADRKLPDAGNPAVWAPFSLVRR